MKLYIKETADGPEYAVGEVDYWEVAPGGEIRVRIEGSIHLFIIRAFYAGEVPFDTLFKQIPPPPFVPKADK
jgi:hypothetical protein